MGFHPINLMLRFLLELIALISFGIWGWKQADGWLRFVLALAIPIILAAAWVTFAVPDDQSRSGAAPIAVPGIIRLLLELVFFAFAIWCLKEANMILASIIYGIVVLTHYIISYDRIQWLLKH